MIGFFFLLSCVLAQWNTLYDYQVGNIYIHLQNNDLLQLNFSITGFDNLQYSKYEDSQLNIKNNQTVDILPSPPENSTIFLVNLNLYAMFNDINTNSLTSCGNLALAKFINNSWTKISLDLSSLNGDTSFYKDASILTEPANNNTAYIYGGICNSKISNRLLSLDLSTMKVANISTATKPQPFYGAGNLLAPNPQTQLLIGGQSDNSWLNMYQLATWDFSSGWSFQQVNQDNSGIDSRKYPLVLPIFNPLPNNSMSTINDLLQITQVFLIGGDELHGKANPAFAKLSMQSNNWSWNTSIDFDIDQQEILGAATIFNTLVVVNSTNSLKRDTSYSLNLYDVNSYTPVSNLKTNVVTKLQTPTSTKSSSLSVQLKAILGTLIPLFVLSMAGMTGYLIYKKKHNAASEVEDIDYQLGAFEHESVFTFQEPNSNPFGNKIKPYVENDSNSTLGAPSLESWVKKRQLYDIDRLKPIKNLTASNETLSDQISIDGATISDESEFALNKYSALPSQSNSPNGEHNASIVNRSVSKLKTSFSPRQTPAIPTSPKQVKKSKSIGVIRNGTLKYDDQPADSPFNDDASVDLGDNSESDVDDSMDVQFLVSSKRRSILKVVNPDLKDINEEDALLELKEESEQQTLMKSASIRQRLPSGSKLQDDSR